MWRYRWWISWPTVLTASVRLLQKSRPRIPWRYFAVPLIFNYSIPVFPLLLETLVIIMMKSSMIVCTRQIAYFPTTFCQIDDCISEDLASKPYPISIQSHSMQFHCWKSTLRFVLLRFGSSQTNLNTQRSSWELFIYLFIFYLLYCKTGNTGLSFRSANQMHVFYLKQIKTDLSPPPDFFSL